MAAVPRCPRRPVVLIVGDDRDSRDMYAEYLSASGFNTLHARTATDGLNVARDAHPDVLVTDIKLPGGIDGLEMTRQLRQTEHTKDLPVVVLASSTCDGDQTRAVGAGCNLYLTKPCLLDTLADGVRRLSTQATPATHDER